MKIWYGGVHGGGNNNGVGGIPRLISITFEERIAQGGKKTHSDTSNVCIHAYWNNEPPPCLCLCAVRADAIHAYGNGVYGGICNGGWWWFSGTLKSWGIHNNEPKLNRNDDIILMKSATLFSMTVIHIGITTHTIFSKHFDEDGWWLL